MNISPLRAQRAMTHQRIKLTVVQQILRALGALLAFLCVVILGGWCIGRLLTDQYWYTQWLWWIPTPAAIAIACCLLLAGCRPSPFHNRRRWRIIRAVLLVLVLSCYFAFMEHRLFMRADPQPDGLRVTHWKMNHPFGSRTASFAEAVARLEGDIIVLTHAGRVPTDPAYQSWLPDGVRPRIIGGFWVISEFPITFSRIVHAVDEAIIVHVELDTTDRIGRPIILHLVDLPSDPKRERWAIAAGVREALNLRTEPAPDIVIGDFNITRRSATIRHIYPGLTHAYEQAGHGYGASFHRQWLFHHIDHILTTPAFRATRYDLLDLGVGRHRAQSAWLTLDDSAELVEPDEPAETVDPADAAD